MEGQGDWGGSCRGGRRVHAVADSRGRWQGDWGIRLPARGWNAERRQVRGQDRGSDGNGRDGARRARAEGKLADGKLKGDVDSGRFQFEFEAERTSKAVARTAESAAPVVKGKPLTELLPGA